MTHYVGGSTQFAHSDFDPLGNPLAAQSGTWSVSNPVVASIDQTGLASWLAPGTVDVLFLIMPSRKVGALHEVVQSAIPATLTATPSSITVTPGDVQFVEMTAHDSLAVLITDLVVDSAVSSNDGIATVLMLTATSFLVLGVAVGSCSITVSAGVATATVAVSVVPILITDAQVTKTPTVALGDVSGAVPLTWTLASRAKSMRLVGNTISMLGDFPVGEFAHVDVVQDDVGGWAHEFTYTGPALFEWNNNLAPTQSPGPARQDSYVFYRYSTRVVGSRTWFNILTT